MSTKQELYDLLAEQLNDDLSTMIDRLENAVLRSKIHTHDNGTTLYRLKVLIHKAAKLRDSIVTTADNGLERSDPWYTSYRVKEEQPECVRADENLRAIAMSEIAAQCKILSGSETVTAGAAESSACRNDHPTELGQESRSHSQYLLDSSAAR